jgi:NTP pyrophosphatase (non-canonical NTP hydrolase)
VTDFLSIMFSDEYQELAMRTDSLDQEKWMAEVLERLKSPKALRLLNAALGMSGEAGEFADMVKKWIFHGHEFDEAKAKKEIGDVRWYSAQATDALRAMLSEIDGLNIAKLRARYPDGFNSAQSINRSSSDH